MPFWDIQKVTETERDSRAKKAAAQAEAKQIVAAAQRAGIAMVEEARAKAEEQVKTLMAQAEKLGGQQSKQALAANDKACLAMRRQAEKRMERAAELIMRRVVDL